MRRTDCADSMASVLDNVQLHADAATGFLKVGIRAPFDKPADQETCREAAALWEAGGLRAKADAAVAEVREECRQKRLIWSCNDAMRLMVGYEKHGATDAALERLGEEVLDEGRRRVEGDGEGKGRDGGGGGGR